MKPWLSAVFALAMTSAVWSQSSDVPADEKSDEKKSPSLDELLERIKKLEADVADRELTGGAPQEKQDEEMERLKKAAAQEKQKEQEELPRRVSKLEERVTAQQPTWDPLKMLSFSTPDGNFTAKIGGRIYVVYRHIFERNDEPSNAGGAPDQFVIDTARIQLDGSFFKDFIYRLEYEAAKNTTSANSNDVYLAWQGLPWFRLQGGQFKVPFSQEETTSSRFIDFAERSIVNRLVPQRDQGFMLAGDVGEKLFEWAAGVFNGSGKNVADLDDEKDAAFRVFVTPFKNIDERLIKQLRVGLDVTVGDQDGPRGVGGTANNPILGTGAITDGDLGGLTIIPFNSSPLVDGLRTRYTFNFSWLYGPASIRAEYMVVNYELVSTAPESDFDITAYYIQGTYLLTGEAKTLENRIKPNADFHPLEGTWGAWELALRYAHIDATDGEDAGVIAPTVNQEASQITFGVNWWWSHNMVVRINWEHLMFDEDLLNIKSGNENEDKQDIFYVRWQIDF